MTEIITLPTGAEVTVEVYNMKIRGIVVGKASMGISESYIVQCTDGQLPNDTYKYDTFIAAVIYVDAHDK